MGLFGRRSADGADAVRKPRISSGWAAISTWLQSQEGLRVLDFGPTSPANINYLTGLGHSVYMANIVEDAGRAEWMRIRDGDTEPSFDAAAFAAANLQFSDKVFDIVLLWDTADYLPPDAVPMLFATLRGILQPGGKLLAFFHGAVDGPGVAFSRYQLSSGKVLQLLPGGPFKPKRTYNTRQIETFLSEYADVRFFLAKDNVREVIASR